jgi:predicted O-methyltransferase YrrM
MSSRTFQLDDDVHAYLVAHGVRETAVARDLREQTAPREDARMQISPEQGAFLSLFVRAMGARRLLEVGTFTGYSALAMASGMADDGEMICCDVSEETAAIARAAWERAGLGDRIDLRIAPAADTLRSLVDEGQSGTWDLMFIDADKPGYATYVELAHALLRVGGVVAIDNVLWSGQVLDADDDSPSTSALRALNSALRTDERWDLSMIPIGDGLTLLCKR